VFGVFLNISGLFEFDKSFFGDIRLRFELNDLGKVFFLILFFSNPDPNILFELFFKS